MLAFKVQSLRIPNQQEILAIIISNSIALFLNVSVKTSGEKVFSCFFFYLNSFL